MFIAMDPPKHSEQRRTVAPAFGPSKVERMRADVVARTSALFDTLPVGTPLDWVSSVSMELTTQMLAIMFDFPWEERDKLNHWSDVGGNIRVERENARRHLSFGYGIHRCVGARVAEMQLVALISVIQKRRLRVNVIEAPEIVPACFVRSYKKIMVELGRY